MDIIRDVSARFRGIQFINCAHKPWAPQCPVVLNLELKMAHKAEKRAREALSGPPGKKIMFSFLNCVTNITIIISYNS